MIKKLLFSLLVALPAIGYSQKQSPETIERELESSYQILEKYGLQGTQDSIVKYSEIFDKKIIHHTSASLRTLSYPFKSLKKHISILYTDYKFRIYSWNNWRGGTMPDNSVLYQYRLGDKVLTKLVPGGAPFFTQLFQYKSGIKTIYLAVSQVKYSSQEMTESIRSFIVERTGLYEHLNIARNSAGMFTQIGIDFNYLSLANHPERPLLLIKYSNSKNIIYVPIVTDDGRVSENYKAYKYQNHCFEEIN